jgi:hypothetical protein
MVDRERTTLNPLRHRRAARWLAVAVAWCLIGSDSIAAARAKHNRLPGTVHLVGARYTGAPTPASHASAQSAEPQKRVCVYDVNTISGLRSFANLVHRSTIDCAMVYTGSPDWAGWVDPWFLHHPDPNYNWAAWVRGSPANDRRQLIISQPLVPSGIAGTNWRVRGAAGEFTRYAREFAHNLVDDGVDDAIIRLSWEANGTWGYQNIGNSPRQMRQWVAFWRKTVQAMRSVPGARFRFDWTINNGYRDISYADYYPGNDVVDIIGDDAYDSGDTSQVDRWNDVYTRPGGLKDLIAFANAHHKPISIPEWGVAFKNVALAGGDDAEYVRGIADVVRNQNVAYESYFFAHEWASQLVHGSRALRAYRQAFGNGGTAVGPNEGTAIVRGSSGR